MMYLSSAAFLLSIKASGALSSLLDIFTFVIPENTQFKEGVKKIAVKFFFLIFIRFTVYFLCRSTVLNGFH